HVRLRPRAGRAWRRGHRVRRPHAARCHLRRRAPDADSDGGRCPTRRAWHHHAEPQRLPIDAESDDQRPADDHAAPGAHRVEFMIKGTIVEALGETELLLPDRVNRGLVANDRVKYYLTLLQAANHHAAAPEQPFASLRAERNAAGVDDASLDRVVEQSRPAAG